MPVLEREKPSPTTINKASEYFHDLNHLQGKFDSSLGLPSDPHDLLTRSYNPVIDRWHVEQLRQSNDAEGLSRFRRELNENMRTNLMERLHAVESYGEYAIKNGDIYSKDFPEKPFGDILLRGARYRAELGSPEQEREGYLGEVKGWETIKEIMLNPNTPVGTAVLSFSPPGLIENTEYTGRFVDKFVLAQDQERKYIERVRVAVDWNYQDYKRAARELDSAFFEGYDGRPIDAWFLAHPIKTQKNIFDKSKSGMSANKFKSIFEHPSLQRLIGQYEKVVLEGEINWHDLALVFNAILNCTDDLKEHFSVSVLDENIFQYLHAPPPPNLMFAMSNQDFVAAIKDLGTRKVKTVGGGGCPSNKGINLQGESEGSDLLSNSVAKFGLDGLGEKKMSAKCETCKEDSGDNHYHCPKSSCNKKYSDETNKSPEQRTKECGGCGFKFGC